MSRWQNGHSVYNDALHDLFQCLPSLVEMPSTTRSRHYYRGMEGISTTRARHLHKFIAAVAGLEPATLWIWPSDLHGTHDLYTDLAKLNSQNCRSVRRCYR